MAILYDRKQITAWLGSHTVAKAIGYAHAVSNLRWQDADTLSGKVQGTRSRPYDVRVHFHATDGYSPIKGECSCPVGYSCKHMAALLLASLEHLPKQPATNGGGVRPELVNWLEGFRARRTEATPASRKKSVAAKTTHALAYVIAGSYRGYPEIFLYKTRMHADGLIRALEDAWYNVENALVKPPKFVAEEDLPILRGLWLTRSSGGHTGSFGLQGATGAAVMEQLLATGRAFVSPAASTMRLGAPCALHAGPARPGRIAWHTQPDTRVRPVLQAEPPATMLLTTTQPCWYLDAHSGEAGPVDEPWSAGALADFLSMPSITPDEAALVGNVLREVAPDLPVPPAHDAPTMRVIDTDPVPVLLLNTLPIWGSGWSSPASQNVLDFATVSFDYAGERIDAQSNTTLLRDPDGEVVQLRRRLDVEQQRLTELHKTGLRKVPANRAQGPKAFPASMLGPKSIEDWPDFMKQSLPGLRESGWQVVMTDAFRHNVIEIDAIKGSLHQAGDGWFDVEMGITVNDRKVRLEPLLADLFRRDARWLSGRLDAIADDEAIELTTDRNERLRLRADRLKPVVRVLIDLFDKVGDGLRISQWDAARLDALDRAGRWQFHGDAAIRQLAQRLMAGPGVLDVPVPHGLQAELRTYQRQGLSWMQFLREHNLSGVLADDMGLGKTVQTLAHILAEKEAGRLDRPALIVVPTTLMHNWQEEVRRFTPALRVLDLHGPQRHERFDGIGAHDLILTTYALLWRDQDILAQHDYHLLILDEAQYVKNAATKSAATIRELRARHRLCLTGTPLENHLGELWAQFDFLLPGFLGARQDFTRRWRTPIEKGGDTVRRELLARRIRPFMLRRRKDEVATELPPKTIIVRTVELEGAQRDLYETVRAAMQEKVRAAVTAKGLARSHIIVLEVLLKLRQVCCDPRLVKISQAARIKESAKLALLLDMLSGLIEEGRRILLFSQFTGMLDLIATALNEAGVPYVVLTGDTTDRRTPVERFQQGEVPLFLISLKAGGVGLNLTAADTVIHYDPWWNPAVENQATDRAHRLGQDKPVFVYKLITACSVEEKIVAMQEQKAALADAILSEDAAGAVKFSAEDIEALFEPILSVTPVSPAAQPRPLARTGS
ncbi:RNA polymerase-associated protein RapA [Paraburkholderia aspalathi]|uniref:DEAD/DEAH box helicase n=1 Tax=Paraburkholderia aspalathi TaxID=1324617 RepID=UPI0019097427|nr:DEAD/DEAH box helicase [Paraburkholderia aspalathi]MBK3844157.1 DEAD/DEAH box helicase [Paraburkholderia aspalathi]CAE6868202.1 RNA polymerase-associated protein RapA [Paraburkholderia aspalathi]CAE6869889.1 RNA polymerase-associated protein RapA [Paraburkholderia aspalathi]